jgi:hypothetical protein
MHGLKRNLGWHPVICLHLLESLRHFHTSPGGQGVELDI